MTYEKTFRLKQLNRRTAGRRNNFKPRPFWLPASNFYILAAASAIAFFFFLWWVLHEGGEEIPYVPAGIGASVLLGSAVFLREVVLRRARQRYLMTQNLLDQNLQRVSNYSPNQNSRNKLSIEQNAVLIDEIKRKSEAALILDKFSEGHWEVFEICNKYLHYNKKELANVGVGSPRLAALRKGREVVKKIHKIHLLNWAEIESRNNLSAARNQLGLAEKLEHTQKALQVLDTAIEFYPGERQLQDSFEAVKEFGSSIRVSHLIELAEKSAFKGDKDEAVNLYRDALFFLKKEHFHNAERLVIEENIIAEIQKIEQNLTIED